MTKLQYSRSISMNEKPPMTKPMPSPNSKLEKAYQPNLGIDNWSHQTNQTLEREIGFIDPPNTCRSVASNTSFEHSFSDLADLDTNSSIRCEYNRKDIIRFWDIGGYNVVLDRCDNGHKLSLDLKDMIRERAELEKEHANSIKR